MSPYELLVNHDNYAVIGINTNPEKFAYKIYKLLKAKEKAVFGIHPTLEDVEGDKVYPNIESLPIKPDIVVFVVSPKYGMDYLEPIANQGIETIWLQPGTISDELVAKATELGLNVVEDCVLHQYHIHEGK